jgi:cytoskeletal protein CcmA (bactofilin family)
MGEGRGYRRRDGQSLALVAVMLPVLVGMIAASVTVGTVYTSATRLQNAVDAAAVAAAEEAARGNTAAVGSQSAFIAEDAPGASGSVALVPSQPNTVEATGVLTVPGGFAALFGHRTFTVRSAAVARWGPGTAFNFAIFQGDPNASDQALTLNGNEDVTGSVHSNNDLVLNGNVGVTGSCGGNPAVTVHGNVSCTSGLIQPAPEVPMPVWTPSEVTPAHATVIGSPTSPVSSYTPPGNTVTGNYIIYGNLVFNGNTSVDGNFLVYGNVTFNGNVSESGSVTAFGGNITLNGNVSQYLPSAGIALAAFTTTGAPGGGSGGAITVNGNDTVNGTLYAPDGQTTLNGNVTVIGAVVANQVVLNGNTTVTWNATDVAAVPVQQVALVQ